jgi:hypothetical protein
MINHLATDPGAWNIIGWTIVIAAVFAFVVRAITALLQHTGTTQEEDPDWDQPH